MCFFWLRLIKQQQPSSSYKKILISQIAHLGDVVLTTSFIPYIKQKFPTSCVDIVVGSWARELICGHPQIQKVYTLNHPKNIRNGGSFLKKIPCYIFKGIKLAKVIRAEQYDLTIDLSVHYPGTHFWMFLAKVPCRIGFVSGGGGCFLTDPIDSSIQEGHITLFYNLILKHLEIESFQEVYLKPQLTQFLQVEAKKDQKSYIVIHLFSGDPRKNLDINLWVDLVSVFKELNLSILISGIGAKERRLIDQFFGQDEQVINLVNTLKMGEFIQLVKSAEIVVSVDTFASHLAAAFNKNLVTIFTAYSDPKTWFPPQDGAYVITPDGYFIVNSNQMTHDNHESDFIQQARCILEKLLQNNQLSVK